MRCRRTSCGETRRSSHTHTSSVRSFLDPMVQLNTAVVEGRIMTSNQCLEFASTLVFVKSIVLETVSYVQASVHLSLSTEEFTAPLS